MNIHDIPKQGCIYRLLVGGSYYVGSTLDTIHGRVGGHASAVKCGGATSERKLYKFIAENGGWEAVRVELVEYPVSEADLLMRERSYVNLEDPLCLNTYTPLYVPDAPKRTAPSERTEERKAYDKEYYAEHQKHIKSNRMAHYYKLKEDPERYEALKKDLRDARARRVETMKKEEPEKYATMLQKQREYAKQRREKLLA
jgi:hypothetical protein